MQPWTADPTLEPGLYVIPTPIGNLEDITLRSIRMLKSVSWLLAEDTRTSRFLLQHLGIDRPLTAFHMHNEHATAGKWVHMIQQGASVGMVSDAGTPGISDPAFLLVRACIEAELPVTCLPGPTAFVPALVMSGLPMDRFRFEGFLPVKKGRQKKWEALSQEDQTLVLYESPHRILKCIEEVVRWMGPQTKVALCREISKKFETCVRGTAVDVLQQLTASPPKGEMVLVIKKEDFNPKSEE